MKKYLSFFLAVMLSVFSSSNVFSAPENISVLMQIDNPQMIVNNSVRDIDPGFGTVPAIRNERTLVPVRAITEAFGGNAEWDQNTQTVTLLYDNKEILLTINSDDAYINNVKTKLDTVPQIIGGRTMVPLRTITNVFDFSIEWNGEFATIAISNFPDGTNISIPSEWQKKQTVPDNGVLKVHFIDVGQGDSIFAELPNNETILIDGGPDTNSAADYISSLGYNHINYVVATHPDADHITGLPRILENMSVDIFYMPEKEHTTQIFEKMLNAIAANGCNAVYARAGGRIIDSDILKLTFLAPVNSSSDNNEMSAVIKLVYKNNSFLFTGDANFDAEYDILDSGYDIHADVLKVGHHGSSSSTSELFLQNITPKYAVISVGMNNRYNHPTEQVLSLLSNYNVNVFRTDTQGTVIFESNGFEYNVSTHNTYKKNEPIYTPPVSVSSDTQYSETIINENTSQTVYCTKTGKKYHRDGCQYLQKSKIATNISEAQQMGLTPCSKCKP